jgi:thiosulfate/3-mercaptopyruvate sulfurtransferase
MPRSIDPVVSTDWLADHRSAADLRILDVRGPATYNQGHVPGAVNAPQWHWMDESAALLLTLPEPAALIEAIGDLGIDGATRVVVVGGGETLFDLADTVHVADTLRYAGLEDVAVLDGGYEQWEQADHPTTTRSVEPESTTFEGAVDPALFVSKAELEAHREAVTLVDAREPAAYVGLEQEEFTERPGHIPGARSLPAPWIWEDDGTIRDRDRLESLVEGVVGADRMAEIVVYCGTSPFAKSWRYLMREWFDYENVRVYEGAAQEWTRDSAAPLTTDQWE